MNEYQKYIHLSKYSRWIDKLKRRETWEETVSRYLDFFVSKFPDKLTLDLDRELFEAITQHHVMPSMRCLWTAGKALERDQVSGFNPVVGETKVLTDHGYTPIRDLVGESHKVLNKNGVWADANFKCYGSQPIYRVSLKKNSNSKCEVYCTKNHRWVTTTDLVKSTIDLKVGKNGDKIPFSSYKRNVDTGSVDYKLGVIHGIIYGDGTKQYCQERVKGYIIRICEDHEEYLNYFSAIKESRVSYPPSANGDPIIKLFCNFAKTHSLKDLPDDDESEDYMVGFIRGWLAADGSVGKDKSVTLCLSEDSANWFLKNSARWGYVVQKTRSLNPITNFGERKKRTYSFTLDRSSLTKDDFLIKRKRDRFEELCSQFSIESVEFLGIEREVFCAEVPDTNTFVLERGLVTGNCAAVAVTHPRVFDEIFYLLMCGCGVGYSVERQYINKLPEIAEEFFNTDTTIIVADSRIGWASALRELISLLYSGKVPKWDLSKVRPAGARLKTFGGRASGPDVLEKLFKRTARIFTGSKGRRLNSLECMDLICYIADAVIAGSVRRSATICLSNLSDRRIATAKHGQFYFENSQRQLVNISTAYTEKPDLTSFIEEFWNLHISRSGERGIVNKQALKRKAVEKGRSDTTEYLLNPCAEAILLDSGGFCNLTEVVIKPEDSLDNLKVKVRLAVLLGKLQSSLTNYRYLRPIWKQNSEEERLLGVSLTGIMDHPIMSNKCPDYYFGVSGKPVLIEWLIELKEEAVKSDEYWSEYLGLPRSKQLTLIKPSGTVSQLVDSSSGIHPRMFPFYIRNVRQDSKDPLSKVLIESGVPYIEEGDKYVFKFPIKSPEGAITSRDMSAIEQLNLWKIYQKYWCDGNPSQTIYYTDDEYFKIGAWLWENWDEVVGLSFFPKDKSVYENPPYEEITEEMYQKAIEDFPKEIRWDLLSKYELDDETQGAREVACSGGVCEI